MTLLIQNLAHAIHSIWDVKVVFGDINHCLFNIEDRSTLNDTGLTDSGQTSDGLWEWTETVNIF